MRLEGSHFTPPLQQSPMSAPASPEASDKEVNKIAEAVFDLSHILKKMMR